MALFREQTQVATECASSRLTSFLDSTERMGEVTGKGDTKMAMSRSFTAEQLILGLTFAVCALSLVDPRFRKACVGLLCRLR